MSHLLRSNFREKFEAVEKLMLATSQARAERRNRQNELTKLGQKGKLKNKKYFGRFQRVPLAKSASGR